jgi:soluble lytic murein transglycosylase-like protein
MDTGPRSSPTASRPPAFLAVLLVPLLAGCSVAGLTVLPAAPAPRPSVVASAAAHGAAPLAFARAAPAPSGRVDALIEKYARQYDVPASLVRRVVARESGGNPGVRNGPYLGLMQIRHDTARSMGYAGSANGLLDADTNLRYAVKYMRGAWLVSNRNPDAAIRHYARGYYYEAKRMGLLEETGLR